MSLLFVDLETIAHPCASEFVDAPDLSVITAAKNLKDQAKIEEDIRKRQREATEEYETKLSRASLDFNVNRIVAAGWALDADEPTVRLCADEEDERAMLKDFWRDLRVPQLAGFCARTFDAPTLIQRSRLLGVSYPNVNLARFGRGDVVDLRDILTFDDMRYEAVMPRSLKAFCRRFGIPVSDPVDGKDVSQLITEGNWEAVADHCRSDVKLTQALARIVLKLNWQPKLIEEPVL